jgi:hypothetical protein
MLVAVAESQANQPLLERLADYVRDWPRPVINRPEHIRRLSRDGVCAALQGAPGIELPQSVRAGRYTLFKVASREVPIESLLSDGGFPSSSVRLVRMLAPTWRRSTRRRNSAST